MIEATQETRRHWTARIGDVCANGQTKTAAREKVLKYAADALSGDASPRIVVGHEGAFGLVSRDGASTWGYRLFRSLEDAESLLPCVTLGFKTRDEAERYAREHLGQWAVDATGDVDVGIAILSPGDRDGAAILRAIADPWHRSRA